MCIKNQESFCNTDSVQANLICGDCIQLMENIPDKSIDMILCDLPFGTTQNEWDKVIPFEPLWGGTIE